MRKMKRALSHILAIRFPFCAGFRDMAESVRAVIAIKRRIFGAAAANRVENDEKSARHV
jgi:hypothetical protein